MPVSEETVVMPPVQFLLSGGGRTLLAFGLTFSIWGIWNIMKPARAGLIVAQIVLSLIPGVIAMAEIFTSCTDFMEMATSEPAPKPAEFAAVAGASMSFGFLGLLATVAPVFLGCVAIHRHCGLLKRDVPGEST